MKTIICTLPLHNAKKLEPRKKIKLSVFQQYTIILIHSNNTHVTRWVDEGPEDHNWGLTLMWFIKKFLSTSDSPASFIF